MKLFTSRFVHQNTDMFMFLFPSREVVILLYNFFPAAIFNAQLVFLKCFYEELFLSAVSLGRSIAYFSIPSFNFMQQ